MKYFLPPVTRSTQTTYQPTPLRRPPEPAPPMPYPEPVGQALSPANPSNSQPESKAKPDMLGRFFRDYSREFVVFCCFFMIFIIFFVIKKKKKKKGEEKWFRFIAPPPPLNVLTRELRPQR